MHIGDAEEIENRAIANPTFSTEFHSELSRSNMSKRIMLSIMRDRKIPHSKLQDYFSNIQYEDALN
ncbi:hypothetical protein T05_12362 [Trichinella murrelli]|uniref:Uncharacterized protein n=1 Tax=Trichinella murrelli TaxID=144512 RepID=A0A0V0TWJ8_9BILA|nr:hypothetical protein T05_12362 [Trichinella murrelli]